MRFSHVYAICLSALFFAAPLSTRAADADDWQRGWIQRWYKKAVVTEPTKLADGAVQLPLTFPGDNEFAKPVKKGWHAIKSVSFTVSMPTDLAPNCDVYFFVKDWDDLWYQIRLGPLQPGETRNFELPLHGVESTARWQPRFHFRPWHQRSAAQIRECGIKFGYTPANAPSDFKTTAKLTNLTLTPGETTADSGPPVRMLPRTPISPKAGDCIEIALETSLPYLDPFDKNEVNLTGTVIRPDGTVDVVRLFYYEDFLFDWQDGHSPLTPSGTPQFRFRYTPVEPGEYTIAIAGTIGEAAIQLPNHSVKVADSAFKGFVRPATFDKRLLMYSRTGTEFWGAALNTRSPYDTRYMDSFPFSQWPKRGISIYRDLFKKYKESGINVIELWMSDWFLGLESIPNAPGAHGIGYLNQHRAWRLDLLMQWAKEFDLHVVILLNNHGKFSTWCDADWKTTAINKAQGGFLEKPEEFFTDERAHASFEKFADYAVARWGFSPNLFTWKLFSEIDLTGPNRSYYKKPPVIDWHRKMGAYMTAQDPNKHMITTHWAESYKLVNDELALVPEIDILTLDAYYRGTGPRLGVDILTGTIKFAERIGKPCVITEYGGNPWADGIEHMMNGHHLASWIGFFGMLPNSPGFWWYPMVEEKNMYERYAALDRFTKGETRAGGKTSWDRDHGDNLTLWELRKDRAAFYWMYDEPSFYDRMQNEPMRRREGESITIKDLSPGTWNVEFWSTQKGQILSTRKIELTTSPFKLDIPPFRGDVAIKVKPVHAP